ncbi:CRTAC1 family protein [Alteromonas sp. MMG017]|uniref:CRTAC1 family protein n=1 Tax=Alteromonas sp. MMG017 TaxID=2822692 RepID=UPI001FFDA89F|nr:CRTAC1 family protein [Alteromonas sp. MMG017]
MIKQKSIMAFAFFWGMCVLHGCGTSQPTTVTANNPLVLTPEAPVEIVVVADTLGPKRITFIVDNLKSYANLSLYQGTKLLADNLNVPVQGEQVISALVDVDQTGEISLSLRTLNAQINILSWHIDDVEFGDLPQFEDITETAGLDKVTSLKYGGPSVADLDQDGDYDLVLNNHNAETSKIYLNNGDGTVVKYHTNLSRWFMQDLHGTALGDYDRDGDLDLLLSRGGGNGKNPSVSYFYLNDDINLVRFTGDAGINKGGRGRGARWIDMDLDGDLDLFIMNETSLYKQSPQHLFFENMGKGRFNQRRVKGLEDITASRTLVTDFNRDGIDDIVMYSPLSLWQGNGDFGYDNVTTMLPLSVTDAVGVMAMTDIDIDNDGDLDLYLARGKKFEHGFGESPSVDFDPVEKTFAIKTRGYKGIDEFSFNAESEITLTNYYFLGQSGFRGKDYPVFLGSNKQPHRVPSGGEFSFNASMAQGWPSERNANGVYLGHTGKGKWKAELVRNGNIFWSYFFTLKGIDEANTAFEPDNRNEQDILLENRNGQFVDVSNQWQIPVGGNALGVTTGDFNNDGFQDLFVYRWGRVDRRIADNMFLNTGKGYFETTTMHGASDHGGPGFGDMGQAFDFDLDGKVDLLSGSEHGYWNLYRNTSKNAGRHTLVKVGYSPNEQVDALGAHVEVETSEGKQFRRIGSAGEIFSQSFLNIVHFGVGTAQQIEQITVRWRNGETQKILHPDINKRVNFGLAKPSISSVHPVVHQLEEPHSNSDAAQAPFIKIKGKSALAKLGIAIGEPIALTADYHAGGQHQVIAADEGGVQFWLRHQTSSHVPVEDRVVVDDNALYSRKGKATARIQTTGLAPTSLLPEGHFYTLRAIFTSSDGKMYEDALGEVILY